MKRATLLLFVALLAISTSAQMNMGSSDVPAYNAAAPANSIQLNPILKGDQLTGASFSHPSQKQAYILAAKVDKLLYQLPCYCYCDRNHGHNSLRSCFESEHGANCGTCMAEAYYAYQKSKAGWTVRQIRAGIERGEWKLIDLKTAYKIQ